MNIRDNINEVQERIRMACKRCGREAQSVKLIAVTKTHPVEKIQQAVDAGLCDLGENRVQELLQKIAAVRGDVSWHLVGHLQTNKVRKVVGQVALIHSVDSLHLAQEINRIASHKQVVTKILIQVNTSFEPSKFGCEPADALSLVRDIARLPNINVCGLMTIGKFVDDGKEVRPCFRLLREIGDAVRKESIPGVYMDELSMGMTHDFVVAIEEGATMVRVGTAIFGERE